MPSVIDQRLASLLHLVQIERMLRVEGIADDAERLVRDAIRAVIIEAERPGANISPYFYQLPQAVSQLLAERFVRLSMYAHDSTVDAYSKGIPRRWLRTINPAQLLTGEGVIDYGYGRAEYDEPVITDGRMSDDEWVDYLKKTIFEPPPPAKVEQIILRPVNGFAWPERVQALSRLVQSPEQVAMQLRDGYAAGETLDQLTERMRPLADNWASSARRIARTEGSRIANEIQRETYQQLGGMMAGVQIIATLDQNTRPHHAARHGRIYWQDGRRRPNISELPVLPDEPNCRCVDVPVLRPPREFENDPAVRAEFATASGDTIPDPSAYTDWFRTADLGRRKMAVGSARYRTAQRLLGGAEPEWTDFLDRDGNLLPIDRMRAETQRGRDARKRDLDTAIAQRMQLLGQISHQGFTARAQ